MCDRGEADEEGGGTRWRFKEGAHEPDGRESGRKQGLEGESRWVDVNHTKRKGEDTCTKKACRSAPQTARPNREA